MKSNDGWEAYIDEESEDIMSVTGNNSSGFLGLPGGSRRLFNGVFRDLSGIGVWWSTSEVNKIEAWHLTLLSVYSKAVIYHNPKLVGFSVRCLKD